MKKKPEPIVLFPGPVKVPDFVIQAIGQSVIHHRTPAFEEFFGGVLHDLGYFFQTQGQVLLVAGSGTTGVEMAMKTLLPGRKVLIPSYGKFSERWVGYARFCSLSFSKLSFGWGSVPLKADIIRELEADPSINALLLTHCETSTGTLPDLESICSEARKIRPDIFILVDAISTVGVTPFYMDSWGIDVAIAASQKGLFNPAGLVLIALGQRAEIMLEQQAAQIEANFIADFASLLPYYLAAKKNNYPFTPPTQFIYGIRAALDWVMDRTLPQIWNQSHHLSRKFKAGVLAIGAEFYGETQSDVLTAFSFPLNPKKSESHISSTEIISVLEKEYGIFVAGGQDELRERIIRVAHFGFIGEWETDTCLDAFREIRERMRFL